MTAIDRTAYPRVDRRLTRDDLSAKYTLAEAERAFVCANTRGEAGRLVLATLLKLRQDLGYFPALGEIPTDIITHLASQFALPASAWPGETHGTKSLYRHQAAVRLYLSVTPYGDKAEALVTETTLQAAETMSDPADLINNAVETLQVAAIDLPAFSTLDRLINRLRTEVHTRMYGRVCAGMSANQAAVLDALLVKPANSTTTPFNRLKQTPGPATPTTIRLWIDRLDWLGGLIDPDPLLRSIAHTKLRQFAAEAAALDVGDIRDISQPGKQHTLLLALLRQARMRCRDEIIEMMLRRIRKTQAAAKEQLAELHDQHRGIEESLIGIFGQVLQTAQTQSADDAFGREIRKLLSEQGGVDTLVTKCETVSAWHSDNHLPLLWPIHARYRNLLFQLLDLLDIQSATQDRNLMDALLVVRKHRYSRTNELSDSVDLSFASQRWQSFVRKRKGDASAVDRRALEVCVFVYLADALQCGDIYVVGAEDYADYRTQLLPWAECEPKVAAYCAALGIPESGTDFVAMLKAELTDLAAQVDAGFPSNSELTLDDDGTPHLKQLLKSLQPKGLAEFEQEIRSRMPERHLLDIIKHAEHWSGYTRHFGPPSGSDPKLANATQRYLFTVFGYGCNLGPNQTACHAPEIATAQVLRRINAQHVNSEKLEAAMVDVINEYVRFPLPRLWGSEKTAIADGTHVKLRENNLMGSTHIRYGGYGGIAYHHIAGTYIALFTSFISCGVWEGVHILDALMKNRSEIQPDTLHADTQGQSEPIFGLSRYIGVKLMPRMRGLSDAVFYRPAKNVRYEHIDALFGGEIDWNVIATHARDMLQVGLSIQAGRVMPSMLLRKLGSYNRNSLLYRAFRELGRVERTLFLLRYISNTEIRRIIRAETTKIEAYNDFLDWVCFGGPVVKSGDPVEQEKQLKYASLVANTVMLSNVADLTDVLSAMAADGLPVTAELVARISPHIREQIRRFGRFALDMADLPTPLNPKPLPFEVAL
jgi:TnpA family transposase